MIKIKIVTGVVSWLPEIHDSVGPLLRTFAPIATAHRYCARKFARHVMNRARALSNKMNNDWADGHCYSFPWI